MIQGASIKRSAFECYKGEQKPTCRLAEAFWIWEGHAYVRLSQQGRQAASHRALVKSMLVHTARAQMFPGEVPHAAGIEGKNFGHSGQESGKPEDIQNSRFEDK